MIYHPESATQTFLDYFNYGTSTPNSQFNDETFAYPNVRDILVAASKILFVIHDEQDKVRQQMVFKGTSDQFNWFSQETLISSSVWNMTALQHSVNFKFQENVTDSIFSVASNQNEECVEIGYLRVTCDNQTSCNQLKWWLDDATLMRQHCGIVYSKQSYPVDLAKGAWASRIQILFQPWDLNTSKQRSFKTTVT